MFYCVLWYVSLYVVVCGMSSEKPYPLNHLPSDFFQIRDDYTIFYQNFFECH